MMKYLYFLFYLFLPIYCIADISGYDSLEHRKAIDLFDLGFYSKSKTSFMELLEKSTPGTSEYVFLLSDLGNIYLHQHEYAIARDLFDTGINQAKALPQIENEVRYANLVFRYSTAEAHLQNNLAAIIGFDEVREIYNKVYGLDHPKSINIILEIAELYLKIGNPEKANSFIDEADELMESISEEKSIEINALLGKARYFYATKSYEESLRHLTLSLVKIEERTGKKSSEYISILPFVSKCLAKTGSPDSAKVLLEFSLAEISEIMGDHHLIYLETKIDYANMLWIEGDYSNSFTTYREIFSEYVRQYELFFYSMSFQDRAIRFNRIGETHEKLSSLVELNPNPETLNQFLQMTILFNNIPIHPRMPHNLESYPLFLSWKDNQEKLWNDYQVPVSSLTNGKADITRMEKMISKQTQSISKKGIVDKNYIFISDPKISEIRKELDGTQAAVEIIRYRQYLPAEEVQFTDSIRYAYLVYSQKTDESVKYGVNINGNSLENKFLTYYRSSINNRFVDDYAYANYWQPIATLVEGYNNLVISPDGAYIQINLLTLRNPETHKYLYDEKKIRLVTSSSDLLTTKKPNPNRDREVFIFGNPDYDYTPDNNAIAKELELITSTSSESGMRYMRSEINEHHQWSKLLYKDKLKTQETSLLESLYSSSGFNTHTFLGDNANEVNLKNLQSPFTVHLSLHGYFMKNQDFDPNIYQDNQLLHSGILFSGSTNFLEGTFVTASMDDGILTTFEIYNLDLMNTELVYLSSCETGLGVVPNDNSIKSFERAFQYAGARSIIMSLWTTESEYEIEFMNLFYYYWLFENKSKRDAFTSAQDQMKNSYERAYYWGSFILLGE